jgi:hypothetical protein
MGLVNHLRNKDGQNLFHAVAYGKHLVEGHLVKSLSTGASPTHVLKLQQMLGRGPWDACEGLWWNGVEVKSDKYVFHPGTQSTGMGDATQGQSAIFTTDTPHSGIAWIEPELAAGMGNVDNVASPPEGLRGIFRTMKVNDYNSSGTVTGFAYSANPAREVADLITRIGRRPASRIDWSAWYDWRDFLATAISQDYTALPNFDGIGLSTSLYNGTAFDTLVSTRVDPVIEFPTSSGSPGVGVNVDNFSAKFEGKIKAKYTETYTFTVTHTHGARLYVNNLVTPLIDQWATSGTHTATIALTAGTFYDIRLEWTHTTGTAELRLKWNSTSQALEVITHRALYPKTITVPRYETHPFFAGPTRLDDAVRTILNLCNSTVQEVNGKLRFFCLEQLGSSSYSFTNDRIVDSSLKITPRDISSLRNSWQAKFRDVNSQYLEPPIDPVLIERTTLIATAGRKIDGDSIEMFNCSVHQAYRMLENIVKRAVDSKYRFEFTGMPQTFPVLAGDRCQIDVEFLSWANKALLILESNDSSSEDTADERPFIAQEWPAFTVYS